MRRIRKSDPQGTIDDANATFVNDGYRFVLDLLTRGKLNELGDGQKSAYSYYNATVGMLALLTMSGNFTLF